MNRKTAMTVLGAPALALLVLGCGAGETSDGTSTSDTTEVTYRDRLPLDSFPGALPSLGQDSARQLDARLEELLAEADPEAGELEAPESAIEGYRAGAGAASDTGHVVDPPEDRRAEEVEGSAVSRIDPAREKVPPVRAVFGADDRGTPRDLYPYRAVGKLIMEDGHCTASLVGPRHILTASHCFLPDGSFEGAVFVPYYERGEAPYGWARLVRVFGQLPRGAPAENDFAVGILDRRLGEQVGWVGFDAVDDAWFARPDRPFPSFIAAGYSGDWYDGHVLAADWGAWLWWRHTGAPYVVAHDGDVVPGASGGPVLARFADGTWRVVGVITAGPRELRAPQSAFRPGYTNFLVEGARFASLIAAAREEFP